MSKRSKKRAERAAAQERARPAQPAATPPWRRMLVAIPTALALALVLAMLAVVLRRPAPPTGAGRGAAPPGPAPQGMAWVPAGAYWMGDATNTFTDAQPLHRVELDGFWIDKTEVTNAQFRKFVEATGYVTVAERPPDPKDFPGVSPEQLKNVQPGSIVFTPPQTDVPLDNVAGWWTYVPGASWRHPDGPGSTIDGKDNVPVVQVCWDDAAAYAKWAGKRLPTEAEWEYAARGGLDRARYAWGNELKPADKWQANIWQGRFPAENTAEDGFPRIAPAGSFPANRYGLYDMSGNVWEWCADWYRPDYYAQSPPRNPPGPADSHDPNEPNLPKKVQRGGSFLCSDTYCIRYLPPGRGKGDVKSGSSHVGFRCAR